MRIGLDLLGGDNPPSVIAEAAREVDANLILIGLEPPADVIVTQEILPDESPLLALRRKRDSSIAKGIEMLKAGEIDAFISTGNTGALIGFATFKLPRLPNIERPGLLAALPTLTGSVAVIDIGGQVDPKPKNYGQFARMGGAYQFCSESIDAPRVGLLNIGTEPGKGTRGLQAAYRQLQESCPNFVGNIEGRDVFSGQIDVLVCGGFAGNIFLKTAEGMALFILDYLKEALGPSEALDELNRRVNYAEYGGAIVCGVDGLVVKCHGFSSPRAIQNSIRATIKLAERDLIGRMKSALKHG